MNNCEYATQGCCMCSACKAFSEAMEYTEKVIEEQKEEMDKVFSKMENDCQKLFD